MSAKDDASANMDAFAAFLSRQVHELATPGGAPEGSEADCRMGTRAAGTSVGIMVLLNRAQSPIINRPCSFFFFS